MLRVTVELDVHGLGQRVIKLGTLEIANDGTGTRERGNYRVWTRAKAKGLGRVVRNGEVGNHPRLRQPVWSLVRKALENLRY